MRKLSALGVTLGLLVGLSSPAYSGKKNFRNITSADYEECVAGDAIVVFRDEWNSDQKAYLKTLKKLAKENPAVNFCAVSLDDDYELAKKMKAKSPPVIFVYDDGRIIGRPSGLLPESELEEILENLK